MPKPRPDFAQVRLSAAGLKFAGDGPLRYSDGRRTFVFQGSTSVEVLARLEWGSILSLKTDAEGNTLFELVPDANTPAPVAVAAEAVTPAATNTPKVTGS